MSEQQDGSARKWRSEEGNKVWTWATADPEHYALNAPEAIYLALHLNALEAKAAAAERERDEARSELRSWDARFSELRSRAERAQQVAVTLMEDAATGLAHGLTFYVGAQTRLGRDLPDIEKDDIFQKIAAPMHAAEAALVRIAELEAGA